MNCGCYKGDSGGGGPVAARDERRQGGTAWRLRSHRRWEIMCVFRELSRTCVSVIVMSDESSRVCCVQCGRGQDSHAGVRREVVAGTTAAAPTVSRLRLTAVTSFAVYTVARLVGPQIRKIFLRPLHLIIRRYPAYDMTTRKL